MNAALACGRYAESSGRRDGGRALLAVQLDLELQIASADTASAKAVAKRLDVDSVKEP